MKVNWQFLKKPSVIIGAIILFFILLFMLNKGGTSSGTTTVTTGPSDAQVAASTQLAMAQMSAGLQGQAIQTDFAKTQDTDQTQIALATIAAAVQQQQTAAEAAISSQTVAAQAHGLDLQYQTAIANNDAQVQALQIQASTVIQSAAINANLQGILSADQLKAYGYGAAVQAIGSAKAGDRDQLTAALIGAMSGQGISYGIPGAKGSVIVAPSGAPLTIPTSTPNGSSGLSPVNFISPITNLF